MQLFASVCHLDCPRLSDITCLSRSHPGRSFSAVHHGEPCIIRPHQSRARGTKRRSNKELTVVGPCEPPTHQDCMQSSKAQLGTGHLLWASHGLTASPTIQATKQPLRTEYSKTRTTTKTNHIDGFRMLFAHIGMLRPPDSDSHT